MCSCIKCGKTYMCMFVAWILGQEHRVCIEYPNCAPAEGRDIQARMQFAIQLTK